MGGHAHGMQYQDIRQMLTDYFAKVLKWRKAVINTDGRLSPTHSQNWAPIIKISFGLLAQLHRAQLQHMRQARAPRTNTQPETLRAGRQQENLR